MPSDCIVKGCHSNSRIDKSITFFLLPWDNIQLRTIWVRLAGYDPLDANDVKHITREHSICSLHFVDNQNSLLHSSIPTLNLPIQDNESQFESTASSRGVKRGSKRGPYKKSALETRKRVLSAAERGKDMKSIATAHGVKKTTAYNWVRRDRASHLHRGGIRDKVKKIEHEHIESLIEWLNDCPQLTLKNLCEHLLSKYGLIVSEQTIASHLDGRIISLKQVHLCPETVNNHKNKLLRKEYIENVMKSSAEGKFFVYISKSNVNLFLRKSKGGLTKGTRAVAHLPSSKGPTIHMIGALCQAGLIDFQRIRGTYRSDSCSVWVRDLLQKVIGNGTSCEQIVMVIDNASCHSDLENVLSEFEGATLLRLAPYSPMLNPFESVWSVIKTQLKQKEANQLSEMTAGDPQNVLSKSERKLRFVERLIDESVTVITPSMCLNFVNHTQLLFGRALQMKDMPIGSNEYDKILETASELYTSNQLPVKSQVIKSAHQQITPSYSLNKLDVEHRRKNLSSSASKSINSLSDANQSFSTPAKVPKKHNFSKPFISAGQTHVIDKPAAVSSSTTDTRSQPIDCSSSSSKNQSFSSKNIQKLQTAPKSEKQLQMSPTIDVSHQKEKRMLVVPNHQSSVMSNMSSLWKAGRLCDAYISNGTVSVMVHQIVFGAVCPKVLPVFYNAFHSDLPAVTFPSTVSEEALLAFCEYMYDGVLELDKNILSQLKIIAQCLDMQGFDQLCNNQLKIAENSVTVPTDMLESILTEPCSSSGLISDVTNTQITCQDNFTPVSQVIPITLYNRNLEENSNVLSSKFPTEIKRKVVKQEISDTSNEQDDINSNHEDDLFNKPQIKVELIGPDDHRYGYQDFLSTQQGSDISDADLTQSSLLSHNTSLDNFEHNSDIQQTEQSLLSSSSLSPHFSLHSESHPVGYITPTSIRRLVSCDKFQHLKNSENSKPYPVSLFSANYEPISLSSSNLQLVNVKKKHIAR
ncbi:uncharacterized protein LOC106872006 isoform X2 [Octopus bimaculoides]|uniref:uncharacterized protein LOC106872006 isoform X2 n=1 Tax=Octopus bimaculoides TaxID=37653 RepID=UPI00071DE304|nr:uncharacterized protein LOC106872006 isoform X2 [Octopus bimaculoides]|eukprot:XP_014774298.1 PREDICTED: uncharacterized protein LOC106872006 isoform X2 [Octopus bimaculoides]